MRIGFIRAIYNKHRRPFNTKAISVLRVLIFTVLVTRVRFLLICWLPEYIMQTLGGKKESFPPEAVVCCRGLSNFILFPIFSISNRIDFGELW